MCLSDGRGFGAEGEGDEELSERRAAYVDLLTEKPPTLNWWQHIARRLGLLKETDAERWFREKVFPIQNARVLGWLCRYG